MRTIYAIRDRIAQDLIGHAMYLIFVFRTDQQAVRYFADALFDKTSILNKHPSDYELVALGTLDQTEHGATIINEINYRIVATGDALIAASEPQLVKEA